MKVSFINFLRYFHLFNDGKVNRNNCSYSSFVMGLGIYELYSSRKRFWYAIISSIVRSFVNFPL